MNKEFTTSVCMITSGLCSIQGAHGTLSRTVYYITAKVGLEMQVMTFGTLEIWRPEKVQAERDVQPLFRNLVRVFCI